MSDVIIFGSTKTYTHDRGLSCCFRQWKAESHCNKWHGYAIQPKIIFEARELDERHWVTDFGGLKDIKAWLDTMFDHTMLVAEDDPHLSYMEKAHEMGLCDLRIVPAVGCEAFAKMIFMYTDKWLRGTDPGGRVRLTHVEVNEHAGNSAYVRRKNVDLILN